MARMRKQPVGQYSDFAHCKLGDRVFASHPEQCGTTIYDVVQGGVEYTRLQIVKRGGNPRMAYMAEDGIWHWWGD